MKRSNGLASCEAANTVGIGARAGPRDVTVAPHLAAPADDLAAARRDRPRARRPWRRPSATRRARPRATIAGARDAPRPRAPAARRRRPRRRRRCGRSSRRPRRAARRCSPAAAAAPAPGRRADCRRPGSATRPAPCPAPVHCAIAQEGAIDACAMKGREYCRRMVRATCAGAAALRSSTVVVSTGWLLSQAASLVSSGRPSPALHAAPLRRAARPASAAASVSATTPAKLPSRTTAMTPGNRARAGSRRARSSLAPGAAGFSTRPCSRPGSVELVDEARPAEHLVGQVEPRRRRAGDAPRSGCLGGDPGAGVARQQGVVGQLPVAGAQVARADDGAVLDLEALGGDAEALGGGTQVDRARLRGRVAHGRARLLDRQAARGGALVGARRRSWSGSCGCGRDRCRARRPRSAPAR